jgi:hypothetical protein
VTQAQTQKLPRIDEVESIQSAATRYGIHRTSVTQAIDMKDSPIRTFVIDGGFIVVTKASVDAWRKTVQPRKGVRHAG